MRKHHIEILLEQGYDIVETHYEGGITGEDWFYKCSWRADASGRFIKER